MSANTIDAAVVYHLRLKDPAVHLLEVTTRIADPDPAGQLFSMPAWIPGSYLIRDYARHVVAVTAEASGEPIALRKTDKSTWRAAPTPGPLLVRAEIYAFDPSVRGAYVDFDRAFFNGCCVFFRIAGAEERSCVVHIDGLEQESDWTLATSLGRLTGTDHEFGAFEASGYEDLIDHPVLIGDLSLVDFQVAGVAHCMAIAGRHAADLERLRQDVALVCAAQLELFGGEPPIDRYSFLLTVFDKAYGGLEHRYSSALACSYDDLPRPGEPEVSSAYRRFLGLVSHEYFHLWIVKRIRPATFAESQLDSEAYTRQLWVFEGITSYYDDLALLRSGLISVESYLELLGRSLTRVYRSRGRRKQTLEDSSFDAWIKFYRQDENSPNALVSYYTKGAMVALALDLELRLKTGGASSLDDVMRVLWREYGNTQHSLPEGGFERIAQEVSGLDLADFFRQALRSTVDPPVGILLAQFGVNLHLRAMQADDDAGGKALEPDKPRRPWLGIQTEARGDRVFVKHVLADGPAVSAGIAAGDEVVAINGWRPTPANLDGLLARVGVDATTEVHLFRRDELHRTSLRTTLPPRDTCYLTLADDADAAAIARRDQWLDAASARLAGVEC
jgi:predicted metalloprotease with PDZ domain